MRLSILLIAICCAAAYGQFEPSVVVEQDRSYGIAMAVNPKDSKNIVLSAAMKVYYTTDGGKTWAASTFAPSGFGLPSLVADVKGNFFFADVTDNPTDKVGVNAVSVYHSDDGGKTWSAPSVIATSDNTLLYVTLGVHPKKEQVAVTWTEAASPGEKCPSSLYFSTSSNGGKKFSDPTLLGQSEGDCTDHASALRSAAPEMLFDGKLFVTWVQGNKLMLDRSYDHNTWLRNDITVKDTYGSWMTAVKGLGTVSNLPSLAVDNSAAKTKGLISIVYAAKQTGSEDTDIFMLRTGNRGDNWTTPSRVDKDSTKRDQLLPRFTIDQQESVMYIIYYDRRGADDNSTDVYLAWSADGGATFKEKKISARASLPSLPENTVSLQQYSAISAIKGLVVVSWVHWDGDKSSVLCVSIPRADLEK
jgi:hypothetical protein